MASLVSPVYAAAKPIFTRRSGTKGIRQALKNRHVRVGSKAEIDLAAEIRQATFVRCSFTFMNWRHSGARVKLWGSPSADPRRQRKPTHARRDIADTVAVV